MLICRKTKPSRNAIVHGVNLTELVALRSQELWQHLAQYLKIFNQAFLPSKLGE
jgi:hypothetical protein